MNKVIESGGRKEVIDGKGVVVRVPVGSGEEGKAVEREIQMVGIHLTPFPVFY